MGTPQWRKQEGRQGEATRVWSGSDSQSQAPYLTFPWIVMIIVTPQTPWKWMQNWVGLCTGVRDGGSQILVFRVRYREIPYDSKRQSHGFAFFTCAGGMLSTFHALCMVRWVRVPLRASMLSNPILSMGSCMTLDMWCYPKNAPEG